LIRKTRHEMAVGLLPHMLTLRTLQDEIEKEYATGAKMPAHASSRFRESLFPPMAMLRLIGNLAAAQGRPDVVPDYRQFGYDFAESRREQLARLKTTSENEQVFETILGSALQTASVGTHDQTSGMTTIRVMLGDLNKLEEINKTKRGVYIDTKMEWLVVNWVEAAQGLLAQSKYRTETPTYLKNISERSPHHITSDAVKKARVLERLVDVMGPCQPIDLISVFSVKHMLDATRARHIEVMGAPKTPVDVPAESDPNQAQESDDGDIVV
jgi:hypothetical protein